MENISPMRNTGDQRTRWHPPLGHTAIIRL